MECNNVLRISCGMEKINKVSEILGVNVSSDNKDYCDSYWEYILVDKVSDIYVDFVSVFLDILEGKYDNLSSIGIERNDISVWIYYEYDEQCNMEFLPQQMKRLGDNDITLCVSCWRSSNRNTIANSSIELT